MRRASAWRSSSPASVDMGISSGRPSLAKIPSAPRIPARLLQDVRGALRVVGVALVGRASSRAGSGAAGSGAPARSPRGAPRRAGRGRWRRPARAARPGSSIGGASVLMMTCSKKSDGTCWTVIPAMSPARPISSGSGRKLAICASPWRRAVRVAAGESRKLTTIRSRNGPPPASSEPHQSGSRASTARTPGWNALEREGPGPDDAAGVPRRVEVLAPQHVLRQDVVAAGDAEHVLPGGVVVAEGDREAGGGRAVAPGRRLARRDRPDLVPAGPARDLVVRSEVIVRQVKTTSARVTGSPSDQRASGRRWNVTRRGPVTTSSPDGHRLGELRHVRAGLVVGQEVLEDVGDHPLGGDGGAVGQRAG